jgi:hypothetical protein
MSARAAPVAEARPGRARQPVGATAPAVRTRRSAEVVLPAAVALPVVVVLLAAVALPVVVVLLAAVALPVEVVLPVVVVLPVGVAVQRVRVKLGVVGVLPVRVRRPAAAVPAAAVPAAAASPVGTPQLVVAAALASAKAATRTPALDDAMTRASRGLIPRTRTAAVDLAALPGMMAAPIAPGPAIGRRRVMTMAATTAQGPAKAAAGAPTSQPVLATVELADGARPSLAASRHIKLWATSGPAGGAQVVRSAIATETGHQGRVATVHSVRAVTGNARDGSAAMYAVPVTVVSERVTANGAQPTAMGARVTAVGAHLTEMGAEATPMAARATVVGAHLTEMGAGPTAIGEQARRAVTALNEPTGRAPSDHDAARDRVHLRPGSPATAGRRANQRAVSLRPTVIGTSDGRRTRRVADDRGPIRLRLPTARSERTCLRASRLTS